MPYDSKADIAKIREYYNSDPRQQRFSALITGETGSGKSYLFRTCRKPVFIDSFDPGGSKCLRDEIKTGNVIVDTRWENEDPYAPTAYEEWVKETDHRLRTGFFDLIGTYGIDSMSSFADAVMNFQLSGAGRAGESPKFTKDYTPQKTNMINKIKRFMTLPCDFIVTGHLRMIEEVVGKSKDGEDIKRVKYRFLTTGQAVVTIPMQFDELYVMIGKDTSSGVDRTLLIDSQGQYIARSRLRAGGKLDKEEPADIKKLLKKIGLRWEDKDKL